MVGHSERGETGPSQRLSSVRRKRTARVSSGQIEALLALLEARPCLFTRKFAGIQGRENFDCGWREIATKLNQYPNGSVKRPEQWMTVWRDFKSRACTKAAKWRKENVQTGNKTITGAPLTAIERRIISLIGVDYTFNTECPDPLSQEPTKRLHIENGVTEERMSAPQSMCDEEVIKSETEQASPEQQKVMSDRVSATTADATSPPRVQHMKPKKYRNLNPRRSVGGLIKMLTAATQLQAEATKMQAETAKTQAEASLSLAQAANKIGDALLMYANKNNVL